MEIQGDLGEIWGDVTSTCIASSRVGASTSSVAPIIGFCTEPLAMMICCHAGERARVRGLG